MHNPDSFKLHLETILHDIGPFQLYHIAASWPCERQFIFPDLKKAYPQESIRLQDLAQKRKLNLETNQIASTTRSVSTWLKGREGQLWSPVQRLTCSISFLFSMCIFSWAVPLTVYRNPLGSLLYVKALLACIWSRKWCSHQPVRRHETGKTSKWLHQPCMYLEVPVAAGLNNQSSYS